MNPTQPNLLWWQTGVMYNLYVRSFRDANGDGIGDLWGVIEKLDYLHNLGVDILWLSGALDSPWIEFGFDVRDMQNVHPAMGNLEVVDELLAKAHERGMKIMLDFIPNHTSHEHPWFQEAKSSRDNPKRDWYIWCDPDEDGGPPNNWLSPFGGSMWEWDDATGQFYLHTFLKEQPDLNWRNPQVVEAMKNVLRFWLERGVDGFRVDAAHHIIKDRLLRDNPPNPGAQEKDGRTVLHETQLHVFDREQYELHGIIRELRKVLDEFSTEGQPRAWIAEIHPAGWGAWIQYYGPNLDEFHFPLSNAFIFNQWKAVEVRILVDMIEAILPPGAWPNAHTGNFDETRMVTRVGYDQARLSAMLLLTLRGTPLIYYGEEIGMHNVDVPRERSKDRMGIQIGNNRDPQRTPMQWNTGFNAGFNDNNAETWLPVAEDFAQNNVQTQWDDPQSMLSLYRSLIGCRRATPPLVQGDYIPVETDLPNIFAFLRVLDEERVFVALNFTDQLSTLALPLLGRGKLAHSTYMDREEDVNLASLEIRPHEGVIVHLRPERK